MRVGDHNVFKPVDCERDKDNKTICASNFQDLEIHATIPHPNYDALTRINNIALLKVSTIDFSAGDNNIYKIYIILIIFL